MTATAHSLPGPPSCWVMAQRPWEAAGLAGGWLPGRGWGGGWQLWPRPPPSPCRGSAGRTWPGPLQGALGVLGCWGPAREWRGPGPQQARSAVHHQGRRAALLATLEASVKLARENVFFMEAPAHQTGPACSGLSGEASPGSQGVSLQCVKE